MVIVVGNEHGYPSSNPGKDFAFHIALILYEKGMHSIILLRVMGK